MPLINPFFSPATVPSTTIYSAVELTSCLFVGQLVDDLMAPLPGTSLTTLELTLSDDLTGTVINNRNHQNVLNQNGVTVDDQGTLVWTVSPLDNAMLRPFEYESHTALFRWTWSAGAKAGNHETAIVVHNLRGVP